MESPNVLVLGGTGYVGGRLIPELLDGGCSVRCVSRSASSLRSLPFHDDIDIVEADLLDEATLDVAFDNMHTVVYLVHSLDADDFEAKELACAHNTRRAAERAGVSHIVYLSGLGDADDTLSAHLRSRHAVGAELAAGDTPVTELRAAVVLGAGSASFEMLRGIVDVLPVMTAPKWVHTTMLQPIAISDVLTYLDQAIRDGEQPIDSHRIVQIGGPDVMSYADLMRVYADISGLHRTIIPIPLLTPGLSAHWVNLVTPLPRALASTLIDSLKNDVVVTDDSATRLSAHTPMPTRRAIESALSAIDNLDIPTRWSGLTPRLKAAQPKPWDPEWAGGTLYEDRRQRTVAASAEVVQRTVRGIGGERGWYGFGPLWAVRGALDKLFGGVGLRRGRRHPDDITIGEAIDFWRVDLIEDNLFRLRAEMKLPGRAWLEWETTPAPGGGSGGADGPTTVVQRARYAPKGLLGRAYWWVLVPFHSVIFPIMLRRITTAAEAGSAGAAATDTDHLHGR